MFLRFRKISFCLLLLFTSLLHEVQAQLATVSTNGHVTAEVISVFSASETSQLNFGRFSPGVQGGEITLTPEGTVSVMGSVHSGTGLHNAASFNLSGDADASFTVSLPSEPVILKHSSSPKTMSIEKWMSSGGSGILQDGTRTVFVGATLKVGTLQDNPTGVYAGTYTVTFEFN